MVKHVAKGKPVKAPVLKKFVVMYTTKIMVEAKNPNEAVANADDALLELILMDDEDFSLEEIFATEIVNEVIHDASHSCCMDDDMDDEDDDEDEDNDEDDEEG